MCKMGLRKALLSWNFKGIQWETYAKCFSPCQAGKWLVFRKCSLLLLLFLTPSYNTEGPPWASVSPHWPTRTAIPALLISQGDMKIKLEHGIWKWWSVIWILWFFPAMSKKQPHWVSLGSNVPVGRQQTWSWTDLGSNPDSATYKLCDFGQIPSPSDPYFKLLLFIL